MALLWDEWKRLSDSDRAVTAAEVVSSLRAAGHRLTEPRMVSFGPPDEPETLALVEDSERGVTFVLVPGGRLEAGLGDAEFARFTKLNLDLLAELDRPADTRVMPYTCTAWSPEQLLGASPVDVAPMLVAVQPLTAAVLGVPPPRHSRRPLLDWPTAQRAIEALGYEMPTSTQLEWAATAGRRELFYWGDELPDPMCVDAPWNGYDDFEARSDEFARTYMGLAADAVAPWPTSNRFGLQGVAGQPVWSVGPGGEGLVSGGADRFFPWQSCGEWLWMLSAVHIDVRDIRDHQGAMVRPVISVPVS